MQRRLGALALALALPLMAIPAEASPITVSVGSGTMALQSYFGDNFALSGGGSGLLNLDPTASTTATVNQAVLNIANYTNANNGYESRSLDLSFLLTLDGVTHTIFQTGKWSITPTFDSVLTLAASTPVEFDTSNGSWEVSLNSLAVGGGTLGTFSAPVTANIQAVPEPASFLLLGTAFVGGGIQRWRKRRMNG